MLLRGGLRDADEVDVAGVAIREADGEGVEASDKSSFTSSACMALVV